MSTDIEVVSSIDVAGNPAQVINMAPIGTGELAESREFREIASQLSRWVNNSRARSVNSSMFNRDRYLPPDNPYDQMRAARHAVQTDDIVGGVADLSESLAFTGIKWESENADEADALNQLSADLNLDAVVRAMYREQFACEQVVVAKLWGPVEYTVRGQTTNGNKRKKTYKFWAPKRLVVLNNLNVVPIGYGPLREDNLAWQATEFEIGQYAQAYRQETLDPLMTVFFQGTYTPGEDEKVVLSQLGVDVSRLLAMNPEMVFRHTGTRSDYQLFSPLRMRSVFALLDLKQQLINSDRASLIGAANYILLIRKGSDQVPAKAEELQNLKENFNFLAKLPVIVSDHRLEIDIIAPKLDFVLKADNYETINKRLLSRLLGAMLVATNADRNTSTAVEAMMAKSIDNQRHMIARSLEREIGLAIVNHPKNKGIFDSRASMVFTPRHVAVDINASYMQQLIALRTQREVSRETILEYMGLDQATEAQRMEIEDEIYDEIFKTEIPYSKGFPAEDVDTNLTKDETPNAPPATGTTKDGANTDPSSTPASGRPSTGKKADTPNGTPEAPGVSGRRGGRPVGGGKSTASPTKTAKPRTRGGNPSTKG